MSRQWLDWRPDLSAWQAVEIVLMSAIALGLVYVASPTDPLGLASGFPWIWLAPVLLALRYGMLSGLLSAALIVSAALAVTQTATPPTDLAKVALLGGLILTMICGEFSGLWRNRLRRQSELNLYLDQRLEELTRQHYLLKLSHDRLEQNLISRPYTLRGALAELRELLKSADDSAALPGAADFIALLAAHCQLSAAAIYPVRNGVLDSTPIATFGSQEALVEGDPLVDYALQRRALVHVNQDASVDQLSSAYLVAAPIYRGGALAGLLAVEQMPFFSFHHDTLMTLAALMSYYADALAVGETREVLDEFPDCPTDFARHLQRLARVQRNSGVETHLAVLRFPADSLGYELRAKALRAKRELDFFWLHDAGGPLLVALFPLTGRDGIQGYMARFDVWLRLEYLSDAQGLGIHFTSAPLETGAVVAQLRTMIEHA